MFEHVHDYPMVRAVDAIERENDLAFAVPPDTSTPAWRVDPGGLQVELPGTFDGLNTSDQVLAVAQVVFTVTENSNTDQVTFIWAGQPVNVPDATGRLLARPVTRQDYGRFAG